MLLSLVRTRSDRANGKCSYPQRSIVLYMNLSTCIMRISWLHAYIITLLEQCVHSIKRSSGLEQHFNTPEQYMEQPSDDL